MSPSRIHCGEPFLASSSETLLDGVGRRSLRTKTVGVLVPCGLRNRAERQQVEGLHGAVLHDGDTQGAQLLVSLFDIHPPKRLGPIPMLPPVSYTHLRA